MRVTLQIDSHVSFDFKKLLKADRKTFIKLRDTFTYSNPEYYKARNLGFATGEIPKLIRSYHQNKVTIFFARGALRKVRTILKDAGHTVKLEDNRLSFPPVQFASKIKLREEQKPAMKLMLSKQQGVVRGPCSSGKTVMLLEAIAQAKQPAMVMVWDTNHQKNWIKEATDPKLLNLKLGEIGGVGGVFKRPKLGKLNICMQQSLWKDRNREFFKDRVGFVGCDEVQKFAARTFQVSVNDFPAKYRLGVSANERRKDGKEFLIYDSFGKVIHNIPDTAIGSRLKSRIYMVPTKFTSDQYEMNQNWVQLLGELTEDERRNQLIVKMVRRSLANNKLCLILTERKAHALWLKFAFKDVATGLLLGQTTTKEARESGWPDEWKKFIHSFDHDKEFLRVQELGEQRKLNVIIATQKGDVGINIRTIDHLHITTPTGGNQERFNQQKGRVERSHDSELEKRFGPKATPKVYYYWDVKIEKLRNAGNNISKHFAEVSVLKQVKKPN